jgi:polar amino acid transport system substrate-binding protein
MRAVVACIAACLFTSAAWAQPAPTAEQKAQLAPSGTLRAAIVTIPFLAKQDAGGQTKGVAPDLAADLARALGVPYEPTAFKSPNEGIAALRAGKADITFLAPTPERTALLDFAPAFMELEITLVVAGNSPIKTLADADQPGRRIVVYGKSANEETARKALSKATIVLVPLFAYKKAFEMIKAGEADGYVDLRDQLASHLGDLPGGRVVPGALGRNDMAIGHLKERPAAAAYVKAFTTASVKSGFVAKSIERAGVQGAVTPAL